MISGSSDEAAGVSSSDGVGGGRFSRGLQRSGGTWSVLSDTVIPSGLGQPGPPCPPQKVRPRCGVPIPKLLVGLSLPFALAFALAWMVPSRPGPAAQTAEPPTYRRVTSDLMIAYIQPRHIELWATGNEGDWVIRRIRGL